MKSMGGFACWAFALMLIRRPSERLDGVLPSTPVYLPHRLQRKRLTNAAIGVLGATENLASASPVNAPT